MSHVGEGASHTEGTTPSMQPVSTLPESPRTRDGLRPVVDEAAFQALYTTYEAQILNYIWRFMGTGGEDARDLTQDTFMKAWLAMGSGRYVEQEKVEAWLYRVATNVCRDELRHRKLVRWTPWDRLMGMVSNSPKKHARLFVSLDRQDDPERVALAGDEAADVERVLAQLHTSYRAVLILREYHDLGYDEIAEVLATTRASVKSLLFRARAHFRFFWERSEQRRDAAIGALA